ncbi:hypothetical protein KIL84_005345 [Mauremys mutica]|uniref:Uncharacterized protein n=1 Tax=Mauremys mutica TaxID=74926 RepID=A0A9D4B611_9SAUR|nr:hypothetical protein KIL84_005345 [Mauremys mutica]
MSMPTRYSTSFPSKRETSPPILKDFNIISIQSSPGNCNTQIASLKSLCRSSHSCLHGTSASPSPQSSSGLMQVSLQVQGSVLGQQSRVGGLGTGQGHSDHFLHSITG